VLDTELLREDKSLEDEELELGDRSVPLSCTTAVISRLGTAVIVPAGGTKL
jgi:hypothetical protein